jgi:hypothetical protein
MSGERGPGGATRDGAPPRSNGIRRLRWAAVAIIPALAAIFILPLALRPDGVAMRPGAQYSDLLISHLPNATYLREAVRERGEWPLWNAQIFAGQPFAADPLAGLWYPPNLLLLILPVTVGFNLLFWLHLAGGGLGVYALLRAEGVGRAAALLAGASFAGTPKLIAHLGAGHASLVMATAWTPWLLLSARRAGHRGGWQAGAWAGAALALTFLADARWAYYAGALAAAYGLAAAWESRAGWALENRSDTGRRDHAAAGLGAVTVAALLAAPLALPLAEFLAHSNRAALSLVEAGELSLPYLYLLGLLIPDLGGFHEWMTYVGVVPLLLAMAGLGRRTWFWAAAALTAGLFALGTNGPLYPLAYQALPGMGLLRVPPRAWLVTALALCVLAGHGARRLGADWLPRLARRYGRAADWPKGRLLLGALLMLAVLDLLRVDLTLLEARPLPEPGPAAAWLSNQPGLFRVYSPSYSLPPGDGLQHLDGVDPLQLRGVTAAIEAATGIAAGGYSVSVPPFATADLAHEHAGAALDAGRLGRLNVRYVTAEIAIEAAGLELAEVFGATRIYANTEDRGRAWIEGATGSADILAWSPDRIEIAASGPGLLVLSEAYYPGWEVTVNGAPRPMAVVDGVLRGVRLGEGAHTVVFTFRPLRVYAGAGLGGAGLLLLAAGAAWPRRRKRDTVREPPDHV